jgi:hypothetical protein
MDAPSTVATRRHVGKSAAGTSTSGKDITKHAAIITAELR